VAYKDEYEVARLLTDPDGLAAAREVAGKRGRIAWKLHPPLLRALGMGGKITIGAWASPAFRLLAKGKHLRGTPLDPFRWSLVRKLERQLAAEYVRAIDTALFSLSSSNLDAAVALAELPDLVRGYEEIKVDRVAKYRAELKRAVAGLAGG
jgi:indolepyruvate ferredoxin oxidoreductase